MVALGGGTLVGVALLYFVGSGWTADYDSAKTRFEEASTEAKGFENAPLYPKIENQNAKSKALDEYRKSVESMQTEFEKFRPKEIKDISPQDFTTHLKAVDQEIRKAFEDEGTTVPEAFFAGFEGYKTTLARPNTTGILDYQLDAIKTVLLELAKTGPSELRNLHRPPLQEEESAGQAYTPKPNAIARALPLEISFVAPEKSAREFLSAIVKPENQYLVIRSLRITNAKKEAPRAADAQFEKPAAAKAAAAGIFDGGFVLPGEEPQPAAGAKPPDAAAPTPAPASSARILAQVLGNEQVQVFVRLDLLQFLPAKKLP